MSTDWQTVGLHQGGPTLSSPYRYFSDGPVLLAPAKTRFREQNTPPCARSPFLPISGGAETWNWLQDLSRDGSLSPQTVGESQAGVRAEKDGGAKRRERRQKTEGERGEESEKTGARGV